MAVKEIPTNIRIYYKLMVDANIKKRDNLIKSKDDLIDSNIKLHNTLKENIDIYKENYNIDLNLYKEFINNKHIDGKFYKIAKGLFINRGNDYELVSDLYELYKFACNLYDINEIDKEIVLCDKCCNLSLKEYTEILRTYYTQVHKELILNGYGYSFGYGIGWICINRCKYCSKKKTLDYANTKKREEELKSQGKRIWNKEEAEWCKKNGIEYIAEDKRVFRDDEYVYEIPLISCHLENGTKMKLTISDYRHASFRGKTNEQLIEECNKDTNKICNLNIDLKTKLTLCNKVDKILYSKFIRNEAQKSITATKIDSKNR